MSPFITSLQNREGEMEDYVTFYNEQKGRNMSFFLHHFMEIRQTVQWCQDTHSLAVVLWFAVICARERQGYHFIHLSY